MTRKATRVSYSAMQTILVVDDEASMRRAVRRMLEQAGYLVREAGSAEAAKEALSQPPPVDAVVSDVLMPGVSGLAFYDELVEHAPHLADRVVFLTGAAKHPEVQVPIEARGVPLISKLDDLQLVVDAVRLALLKTPRSP